MRNLPTVIGNKFTTYLLYAVGEIVLVVIGILIAVSINNWNQDMKSKQLEIRILKEIRENIREDLVDHNQNIDFMGRTIKGSEVIMECMDKNLPYHDSLKTHFAWLVIMPDFDPINSGYNLLVSEGANAVSNDSLRKNISYLYNNTYSWIEKFYRYLKSGSHRLLLENVVVELKEIHFLESAKPKDYPAFIADKELRSYIHYNAEAIRAMREAYVERLKLVEEIIVALDNEISRLEN